MRPRAVYSNTAQEPIDIIIPNYGTGHLTQLALRCLESIRQFSSIPYRLIFVDNGSPEFDAIIPELEQHRSYKLIRFRKNRGFVIATNAGIWMSTSRYIVLMNNDTEAAPHWLERLRQPLDNHTQVALCGPRTTAQKSWQGNQAYADGWRILPANSMLAFFCVMIRRDVIDTIGVLGEEYGVGFGDDDDYCLRAQQAGFQLALRTDLVIPHHHRSTFSELYSPEEISDSQWTNYATYWSKRAKFTPDAELKSLISAGRMKEKVVAVLEQELRQRHGA